MHWTRHVVWGALLLAACTDSGSLGQRDFPSSPAGASGLVTPGPMGEIGGNVGNTVYFETDSAVLMPDAQLQLQEQAAWLALFRKPTITIEGYADERGTREYNLALGERRAQATMNYLIALGLDPARAKTISYGKERPVCIDATEDCWSRNRRTVTTLDQ